MDKKQSERREIRAYLTCVRFNQPVVTNEDCYEIYEQMHSICFHFEMEHGIVKDRDPKDPRTHDPNIAWENITCPHNQIQILKEIIIDNGIDLEEQMELKRDEWSKRSK